MSNYLANINKELNNHYLADIDVKDKWKFNKSAFVWNTCKYLERRFNKNQYESDVLKAIDYFNAAFILDKMEWKEDFIKANIPQHLLFGEDNIKQVLITSTPPVKGIYSLTKQCIESDNNEEIIKLITLKNEKQLKLPQENLPQFLNRVFCEAIEENKNIYDDKDLLDFFLTICYLKGLKETLIEVATKGHLGWVSHILKANCIEFSEDKIYERIVSSIDADTLLSRVAGKVKWIDGEKHQYYIGFGDDYN